MIVARASEFPLRATSSGSYFVTPSGRSFPLLGRKCGIVYRLPSIAAYEGVLNSTLANGFNAIELKLPIAPSPDNGDGRDSAGNLPFLKALSGADWTGYAGELTGDDWTLNTPADAPDFSTPNSVYWAGADAFFAACESRALCVCWFPAYVGFYQRDWWMLVIEANGATKMQTYGAFVASRYQRQANLIWMLGGDKGTGGVSGQFFTAPQLAALTGFHAGLKGIATVARMYSAEWERGSITTDLFTTDMTTNGTYAAALDINAQGARARAYVPALPTFCQEYPFEREDTTPPPDPPGIVRRLTMWAWLSTIGGYIFGNGILTNFVAPTYLPYLNTQGTRDCLRLNTFIRTINWQVLQPNNAAITAGGGTVNTDDQVVAATATGIDAGSPLYKSLLLVYVPPAHTGAVTIDMTQMRGAALARWWDPTTGAYTPDASGIPASGTHNFTTPGNNAFGDPDWLLRLDA